MGKKQRKEGYGPSPKTFLLVGTTGTILCLFLDTYGRVARSQKALSLPNGMFLPGI